MSNEEIVNYLRQPRTEQEVKQAIDGIESRDFDLVERLAYYAMKGYDVDPKPTLADVERAMQILENISTNARVSDAGYASINPGERTDNLESSAPVWLLWLLIKNRLVEYWSFIIPATLNMIDSSHEHLKAQGARFFSLIADGHMRKLTAHGLLPVFRQALEPLMSYVPPGTSVDSSLEIVSAAADALLVLAENREDCNNLIIQLFAALEHAQGHIEYTCRMLACLRCVVQRMGVNAVPHLRHLTLIFKAVASDPFLDMSPKLVDSLLTYMAAVMTACKPRISVYRYEIMYGVIKGKLEATEVGELTRAYFTKDELKVLESFTQAADN